MKYLTECISCNVPHEFNIYKVVSEGDYTKLLMSHSRGWEESHYQWLRIPTKMWLTMVITMSEAGKDMSWLAYEADFKLLTDGKKEK